LVAALLAFIGGRRAVWVIAFLAIAVTIARIVAGETISIVSWHRVDEILAGGFLALLYAHGRHGFLRYYPLWLAAPVFLISCHPDSGSFQYLRPYAAAAMVGTTLNTLPGLAKRLLESAPMSYIASISDALYVVHAILVGSWLGSGDKVEKYLKRPLLVAATFALAHLSTRYLERPFLKLARNGQRRIDSPASS
jgi:peptidoglycan/LPS O-acetylase OafA/YrhL